MELFYWSVLSSRGWGKVLDGGIFIKLATSFNLSEYMKIWCKIQEIIYPLAHIVVMNTKRCIEKKLRLEINITFLCLYTIYLLQGVRKKYVNILLFTMSFFLGHENYLGTGFQRNRPYKKLSPHQKKHKKINFFVLKAAYSA